MAKAPTSESHLPLSVPVNQILLSLAGGDQHGYSVTIAVTFVLICMFGGAPTEIAAKEPLASGSRVRVTAPDCALREQAATLQALRADTLVLETTECPLASVTRLEVSQGRKTNVGLGIFLGSAAGALGAAVYCSRDANEFSDEGKCEGLGTADYTWPIIFTVGIIGGVVGGIIGYEIKTERWEEIPLDQLRVSLAPQGDGGFALGFSVRF